MYVLCANGGKRQEVQQVHFHMFKEYKVVNVFELDKQAKCIYSDGCIDVFVHPNSNWEIHLVVIPSIHEHNKEKGEKFDINTFLIKVIRHINALDSKYNIVKNGYTVVYQNDPSDKKTSMPAFHIISGKKLC